MCTLAHTGEKDLNQSLYTHTNLQSFTKMSFFHIICNSQQVNCLASQVPEAHQQ